ncbi:phosphatidylinositol-glycan biosynthesis class S protein [Amylocystis lapponica]|nr:phosphatidylinositol-glycan biosynthesis class S protein [Amylocystis lapponica]
MDTSVSQSVPNPTQLTFESVLTRRYILASYWLVVLLAVPLWWTTTSIDRLSLPASRVGAQQNRELVFPVHVQIDLSPRSVADTLVQEVQRSLDADLDVQETSGIRIHVTSKENFPGAYQVVFDDGAQDPTVEGRRLSLGVTSEDDDMSNTISSMRLTDTLTTLLAPYSTLRSSFSQASRVVKYASRYRLAFTLLNEDAASGVAAMTWEVQDSISKHIAPVTGKLSMLHNFTIESQVQYHAPLAFEPRPVEGANGTVYGLTQEDLTIFINSADWTLSSSVSNDPVLHFVLFVPSAAHNPIRILGPDGLPVASNAFILPQWGGVVLYNPPASASPSSSRLSTSDLDSAFAIFHYQLMTLLGVPGLSAHLISNQSATFTDWQLDALLRRRAVENVMGSRETLRSIVRLVDQIENMPVGKDVQGDVQDALAALDQTYSAASTSPALALHHSSRALTLSSRAFFNPGMLALLYFPAEHKYAVYTPLFASVAAPLVATLVREVLAWRRARRASAAKTKSTVKGAQALERLKVE